MAETAAKAKNARGHPKKVQDPLLMTKKPAKRGRPKKVEWPTVSKNEAFVPATSSTAKMADKKSAATKRCEGYMKAVRKNKKKTASKKKK